MQKERKLSISVIRQQRCALECCCTGPTPWVIELDNDEDEMDDLGPLGCDEFPDETAIKEGDRIFATTVPPEAEFINATSTTSQRLAEAHAKISKDPRDGLPENFYDYLDVFSKESFDVLPTCKPWDHAIELIPDSKPANCKVYPLAPNEQKALDKFLTENLSTGRIRPSKSPMASPVIFVKKKNGKLRMCIDYQKLNDMTIKNAYPLPLVKDLLGTLWKAKIFTKLDLKWGYNLVRVKEGDEWKAAFKTKYGMFEPLVMQFGLANAPAVFMHFMNDIFRDLLGITVRLEPQGDK